MSMSVRKVYRREYEKIEIVPDNAVSDPGNQVTASEADMIEQSAARFGCTKSREWFSIVRQGGSTYLKTGCWVGVISAGNLRLEVGPKIGDDQDAADRQNEAQPGSGRAIDLIEMLIVVGDLPGRMRAIKGGSPAMDSHHELIIRWYLRELENLIGFGLLRDYRESRDHLPTMKGRLDYSKHWVNRALRRPLVACVHDEFTQDTTLNRILKAGLRRAGVLSRGAAGGFGYRIRRTIDLMDSVSDVEFSGKQASDYRLSRREVRFAAVHTVACYLIDRVTPDPLGGRKSLGASHRKAVGHMLNMEDLFERYAYSLLSFPHSTSSRHPYSDLSISDNYTVSRKSVRRPLINNGSFKMVPDLIISGNGRGADKSGLSVELIADTKWKKVSPARVQSSEGGEQVVRCGSLGVKQADVYQLFAYSEFYGRGSRPVDVALIYPTDRPPCAPLCGNGPLAKLQRVDPGEPHQEWRYVPGSHDGKGATLYILYLPIPTLPSPARVSA